MFQKDASVKEDHNWLINLGIISLGVVILFGCSQISIPLHPVPINLGTIGVMFIILTYDAKKAVQTVMAYVALGALGAPVFSSYRGGVGHLLGPTGGYIAGYILATLVAFPLKNFLDSYRPVVKALVLSCIGYSVIMVSGLFWLSFYVGFAKAVQVGFLPFIIPGLIKSGILTLTLRSIGYFKKA